MGSPSPEARRRSLFLTGVGALVIWLAYLARDAVTPLLVALILAYVLAPLVAALERRGMSRIGAVSTLFLSFFGTVGLAVAFGVPPLLEQGQVLVGRTLGEPARTLTPPPDEIVAAVENAEDGPVTLEDLRAMLDDYGEDPWGQGRTAEEKADREGNYNRQLRLIEEHGTGDEAVKFRQKHADWFVSRWEGRLVVYDDRNGDLDFDPGYIFQGTLWAASFLRERFRSGEGARAIEDFGLDALPRLGQSLAVHSGEVARGALGVLGTLMTVLGWAVIIPLFTFFFQMHLEDVWSAFKRYLPGTHRQRVIRVLGDVHKMLMGFFRGRTVTMILKGLMVAVGLLAVGAPYWPVFGALAGLLTIVPAAGPLLAAVPGVIVVYAESGMTTAVMAVAVYLAAEAIEGYILIPQLVGREVGLHPLAVVASILVGAALLGILGVVLAIPLAAAAKIVWREFVLPDLEAKAAERAREAEAAAGDDAGSVDDTDDA